MHLETGLIESDLKTMQITKASEYGVLGLMALARRPAGTVVMIDEVSREESLSRSFMAKIFQSLSKSGLVRSVRGTGGGFVLAKKAEEITVLSVIEAIEGPIALQRCLEQTPVCSHLEGCVLCGLFAEAQSKLKETLGRVTVADLVKRKAHLPGQSKPGVNKGELSFATR